jgi:hypothetical protein
VGPDTSWVGVA